MSDHSSSEPDFKSLAAQLHSALDDLYLFIGGGESMPGIYARVEDAIDAYEAAAREARTRPTPISTPQTQID